MSIAFIWALLLLLLALTGWFHQEHRRIRHLAFVHFPASWIGQSFPIPLSIIAASTLAALLAFAASWSVYPTGWARSAIAVAGG